MELLHPTGAMLSYRGGLNWAIYTDIEARYDMTVLADMFASSAAQFDGTNYAEKDTAAATAYPITMVCWFKKSSSAATALMWCGDKDSEVEYVTLWADGTQVAAEAQSAADGAESAGESTLDPDDGDWHFAAGVFTSGAPYQVAYGDSDSTNGTAGVTIGATYDRTTIGRFADSSPTGYAIDDIDNAFIFTAALTAGEIAYLQANKPTRADLVREFAAGTANCPDPSNITGAWKLGEKSGLYKDDSGNDLHLTRGGIATGVTFASAGSEWAHSATTPITTPSFSACCSFKTTDNEPAATLGLLAVGAAANDKQILYVDSGNKLSVFTQSSAGTAVAFSVAVAADQAWHFGGGVFTKDVGGNSISRTVYLDGADGVPESTSRAPDAAYTDMSIGSLDPDSVTLPFKGTVDNVSFWSIALTLDQYTWLRTAGPTGGPATHEDVRRSQHADNPGYANIAAWYQLNESTVAGGATLVNVHNSGTYDLTTASTGAGPVSATGHVTDLPIAVAGTVDVVSAVEDRALEFDGADQSADANTAAITSYGSGFTIAAWVRSSNTDEQTALWIGDKDADDEYLRIGIDAAGKGFYGIDATGGEDSEAGTASIDDGDWHLILLSAVSITDRTLYVDAAAGVQNTTSMAITNFDRTSIGRHGGSTPATHFDGSIDEVAVFPTALSSAQRTTIYNLGVGMLNNNASLPTASAYWSLSKNNIGDAGEDQVGSLDLTLANSPTDTDGIPAGQVDGRVRLVSDKTSNSNDLTQDTFDSRPEVVHVADGTGYALQFDGVDDVLQTAAYGSALSQTNTVFITTDITDNSADQGLMDGIVGTSEQSLQVNATGDLLRIDGGTAASTTIGADYGTTHTLLGVFAGASSVVYQDGGTGETESAGTETMTGLTVGALQDGTTEPAKMILRQIVVNDGALTTAELNEIGAKLAADQSLTWTDIT